MTEPARQAKRLLFGGHVFSPKSVLFCAILFGVPFLISHALGWREHTGILSGTLASWDAAGELKGLMGLGYACFYLVFTLVVPVLVLGSLIFWALLGLAALERRASQRVDNPKVRRENGGNEADQR